MNVTPGRADIRLLTLTEESNLNVRVKCCPLCWKDPNLGDQVVIGKGTEHVCLECAQDIEQLIRSGRRRRCSRHGCSTTFAGQGRGQYCSNACRQAAYRARR